MVLIATASYREVTLVSIKFTVSSMLPYRLFFVAFVLTAAIVPLGIGISVPLTDLSSHFFCGLVALSAAKSLYIGFFKFTAHEFFLRREMMPRKIITILACIALITVTSGLLVVTIVHHG